MDPIRIVEALRATLDPNQQKSAEAHLSEVHKIVGFTPTLLQIVMNEQVELPVRQAGVIYLKNTITQFWQERVSELQNEPIPFSIHENDKISIRSQIVEAIIAAPDPIRVQLKICMYHVTKHDFPNKWSDLPEKLTRYLTGSNASHYYGCLLAIHSLVKNYEFRKNDERGPLTHCMAHLLPIMQQLMIQLAGDNSEYGVLVQKQILKITYALIQFTLTTELYPKPVFSVWIEIMQRIIERPVPEACNQIDEEDRPELIWWKCKKWAMHNLDRLFERYGSPGKVLKVYNQFADWYLKSFSGPIIGTLLKLLDQQRCKIYVSPRVLKYALNYITNVVSHAPAWRYMKSSIHGIIQEVIFPLMCHSDEDNELWESDPVEYIRVKFDIFEDIESPSTSAASLLQTAAAKRKDVLQRTMGFCMSILTSQGVDARQKDGALHMIGSVAEVLLKRKIYKDQAESFLVSRVFPELSSPEGFLRSRACWVIQRFSECEFRDPTTLQQAAELLKHALCTDQQLPVQVESALALQVLLADQDEAQDLLRPHIAHIITQLLNLIRQTEFDDINTVLQKFVVVYEDDIAPLALQMTQQLVATWTQVIASDSDDADEKAVLAMGILNTIETILNVVEEQRAVMNLLEPVVVQVIHSILHNGSIELYEEAFSLVYSLTCQVVTPVMWEVFVLMYQAFNNDAFDYFTDMMPALHNYVTIGTDGFLVDNTRMDAILSMCGKVLQGGAGEDPECHSAKLLEVILLSYAGQLSHGIVQHVLQLAVGRLTRTIVTSELRTMCLQVGIAALYTQRDHVLRLLTSESLPGAPPDQPIFYSFFQQWLTDTDCFLGLHDRKLSVLGLCQLLAAGPELRPSAVLANAAHVVPSILKLFEGLKRAYAAKASGHNDDDLESGENGTADHDVGDDAAELESDEDDLDDTAEYLDKLEKIDGDESDSDDDDYDEFEETALESYETPLDHDDCAVDEYAVFRATLVMLRDSEPSVYEALCAHLTPTQQLELQEVLQLAEQRQAAAHSRTIQQQGGYAFSSASVPQTFNFGTGNAFNSP